MNKLASWTEIESHYSLTDVLDANDALDLQLEADRLAHEHANAKSTTRVGR